MCKTLAQFDPHRPRPTKRILGFFKTIDLFSVTFLNSWDCFFTRFLAASGFLFLHIYMRNVLWQNDIPDMHIVLQALVLEAVF